MIKNKIQNAIKKFTGLNFEEKEFEGLCNDIVFLSSSKYFDLYTKKNIKLKEDDKINKIGFYDDKDFVIYLNKDNIENKRECVIVLLHELAHTRNAFMSKENIIKELLYWDSRLDNEFTEKMLSIVPIDKLREEHANNYAAFKL